MSGWRRQSSRFFQEDSGAVDWTEHLATEYNTAWIKTCLPSFIRTCTADETRPSLGMRWVCSAMYLFAAIMRLSPGVMGPPGIVVSFVVGSVKVRKVRWLKSMMYALTSVRGPLISSSSRSESSGFSLHSGAEYPFPRDMGRPAAQAAVLDWPLALGRARCSLMCFGCASLRLQRSLPITVNWSSWKPTSQNSCYLDAQCAFGAWRSLFCKLL